MLLTGVSGQTSFGQASFVGLAAYATTLLTKFAGMPPIVGLLAGLAGDRRRRWLLGLITARLSGHFLALVSVAWGICFFSLFGTLPLLHGFNGIGDIPPLSLGPLSAADQRVNLGVILGGGGDCDGDVGQSARQPHGPRDPHAERRAADGRRAWDRHGAAQPAGVRDRRAVRRRCRIPVRAFPALHQSDAVRLGASIDYLFMVIIGGAESLWGAPVGAALVVVLRDQFNDWIPRITGRAGDFEALVFSLVVIVLLQRAPEGLLPLLARLRRRKAQRTGDVDRRAAEPAVALRRQRRRRARNCSRCRSGVTQLRRAGREPRRELSRSTPAKSSR